MRTILLVLFFLFWLPAVAQSWEQLNSKVIEFYQKGEYQKALGFGKQAVGRAKTEFGLKHPNYATSLNNLAHIYVETGQYDQTLALYQQVLKIREQAQGKNHPNYAASLNNLAYLYGSMGLYEQALPLYQEALTIRERVLGKSHPDYATSLNNLSDLYEHMGQYQQALPLCQQALKIRGDVLGKDHQSYAQSLNNLAGLYRRMGQYDQALPLYKQALLIIQKALGNKHPTYAQSLNNLAYLYVLMDRYKEALALYKEALQLREKILGKNHPYYANSLNNLADLYERMGRYEQALPLYRQALQTTEKLVGKSHPDYATKLNNLAHLYDRMGLYEQALSYYQQALMIREQTLDKTHPDRAQSLNNLATLYSRMGQYEQALPFFQQALLIREQALGKNHPEYAQSLNNLADLYENMGRYEQALPLFQQALQITEKVVGKNHPDYVASLNNLATLYYETGRYEQALPLFQQVSQVHEQSLGKNHPDYATSLNNLGELYQLMGHYEQALLIFQQSSKIYEQALGKAHPNYATSLNNRASLYQAMGQYEQALPLFYQACKINEQALGKSHASYVLSLNNLANLYAIMGRFAEALPLYEQARLSLLTNFKTQALSLSEQQAQQYQQTLAGNFEIYDSFALLHHHQFPILKNWLFDNALFWKGQLLEETTALRRSIQQANDSTLTALFAQWQYSRQQLGQQQLADSTLLAQVEDLEQQLAQRSAGFRKATQDSLITFKQIKKHLKPGEVAIEFVHFNYYNDHRWTDSTYYCASVLRPTDSIPTLVYLCQDRQLDSLLRPVSTNAAAIQHAYASRGAKLGTASSPGATAQRLYQLIWKPLEPLLSEGQTIYYAPTGLLHKVAMAALPTVANKRLMDHYLLHQVSSTRRLSQTPVNTRIQPEWQATLLGGVDYQADSIALTRSMQQLGPPHAPALAGTRLRSSDRGAVWDALPGTVQEVSRIEELLISAQISTHRYEGAQASEDLFKSLAQSRSPELIHLATHGFFFPDPRMPKPDPRMRYSQTNRFSAADDPLLRSGIVLAGANRVWLGKPPLNGLEDGILTAYEVAQLDLTNTKLVVLSACETALGDIKGSEGVFGLQRSFKAAGVAYLLMSLWQVPDKETAEMMQLFYSRYLQGVPLEQAFRQAQIQLRNTYEPYYWAAFVLVR